MSRLTIEQAISHAIEVARENKYRAEHKLFHRNDKDEISACLQCAEEHEQLAEWLEELKRYKDLEEQGRLVEVIRCKDCIRYGDEYVVGAGWCDEHEHLTNDDDYCSYAVAKLAEMECAK